MVCQCKCKQKLIDKIIEKLIIKPWPGGGFSFRMDKAVGAFEGAVYMRGEGHLHGRYWTETREEALKIISEYPEYVKIEVSMKWLADFLTEEIGGKDEEDERFKKKN